MVHRFRPMLGSVVALVVLLGLSGCGSSAPTANPLANQTIKLSDATAANLQAVVQVTDNNPDYQVDAVFYITRSKPMDTQVEFTGDQTMSCGKVKLAPNGDTNNPRLVGTISGVAPGHTVNCVFSSNGVQTALSLLIPPKLVILSPKECTYPNDCVTVPHDKPFVITYQPAGPQYGTGSVMAEAFRHVQILFWGGATIDSTVQPDTGTCHLDISGMPTGGGDDLTLYRELDATPAHTGFQSLTIAYLQSIGFGNIAVA